MTTTSKDFKVKNGLIVSGTTATVNGSNVLTENSNIQDLANVTITDPTTNQVLKYNGSAWINGTDNQAAADAISPFLLMGA